MVCERVPGGAHRGLPGPGREAAPPARRRRSAAHYLRFHAVERFIERHADLLMEEGLLKPGDDGPEPDPLLMAELVGRPYDTVLTSEEAPGFDAGAVLKAVARRARGAAG